MSKRESRLDKRKKTMEKDSRRSLRGKVNLDRLFLWISVIFAVLLATIIISSIVFFHTTIEKSEQAIDKDKYKNYKRVYAMIVNNMEEDFRNSIYKSALRYAKENDVYVELLGDDLDKEYTKEDLLRIALNSKYDGIILEGNGIIDNRDLSDEEDDENLSEFDKLLNEAKEKNVPIITINEDVSTNYRKSFVCINRYILGREYGQQLCDYLDLHNRQKKSGSLDLSYDNDKYYTEGTKCVVKILYDEAQSVNNLTTVMSGIKSRLAEDKKTELFDIEIIPVDSESYYAAEEEVRDVIGDKEEDRPDVMICLSENLTSMAHSALAEKVIAGKIQILGFYYISFFKEELMLGNIRCTVAIDTGQMGRYAVKALEEFINTGHTSDIHMADLKLVNKDNLASFLGEGGNDEEESK